MANESEIPAELAKRLVDLDESLTDVEGVLSNIHQVPLAELLEQVSPLEKAKLDLVGAYVVNSLFWVYLNIRGINPKEHAIKQELDRIRSYMTRVKEIQDKEKAPKLNVDASKRFVRNALWAAAHKQSPVQPQATKRKPDEEEDTSQSTAATELKTLRVDQDAKKKKKKHKNLK